MVFVKPYQSILHCRITGFAGLLFLLCLAGYLLLFIQKPWRLNLQSLAAFLNQQYPELEESAELTIKSPAELTLLQRLQLTKVEHALSGIPALPKEFTRRLKTGCLVDVSCRVA
jgi:hypothetical protein